jgi:thiamine-monophosphate kinase
MMRDSALGAGAEFDAIRALLARWGERAAGIGDDAAVVDLPRGDSLVVSVDAAVEGRHFTRDWFSSREIGYRAVAAAMSDLAAMAARPLGVLVAITLPASWREQLLELADGMGDAVDAARTRIRGGNLSDGDTLTITTTVLGSVFTPLRRTGARPGDRVYVTGRLGGPRAAIRRLSAGKPAGAFRDRLVNPVPRLDEGRWLAEHGASSGIDLSDGLLGDVRHLAAASGVDIELDARRVPTLPEVDIEDALRSGEEYELVVTSPNAFEVSAFEARFGVPLTEIGAVTGSSSPDRGRGSVRLVGAGPRVADAGGYDHFTR